MANAAAKKAAAAKTASANVYLPLLLGSNALYIILLLGLGSFGIRNILGMLATWGLQAYSYIGILDQAANANSGSKSSKKALVGGHHLDLLGLTLVVQYGSVLHSTKWYWLLVVVPLWGGWTLYSSFFGGKKNKADESSIEPTPTSDATTEKRQKRAEKRRQKWSS